MGGIFYGKIHDFAEMFDIIGIVDYTKIIGGGYDVKREILDEELQDLKRRAEYQKARADIIFHFYRWLALWALPVILLGGVLFRIPFFRSLLEVVTGWIG